MCIEEEERNHFSMVFCFKWRKTGKKVSPSVVATFRAVFSELKIRFLIPRSTKKLSKYDFSSIILLCLKKWFITLSH